MSGGLSVTEGAAAPSLPHALRLEFLAAWRALIIGGPAVGADGPWRQLNVLSVRRPQLMSTIVAHPGDPLHEAVEFVRRRFDLTQEEE